MSGRTVLRAALVFVLLLQVWQCVTLTRYNRKFVEGELAYDRWDAELALVAFESARSLYSGNSNAWRRVGDMALYIHDYPGQVEDEHDPSGMLDRAWDGFSGAVRRSPLDSWSWTGLAEVTVNRLRLREADEGLDLGLLQRLSQGVLDPDRATALAAVKLALWIKPNGFQELDVLASVYDSMGDTDRAEQTYVESARIMPVVSFHNWGGRRLPPRLYNAILGGLDEGIERAPAFERNMLHVEVAQFARKQQDYGTAVRHAERALARARNSYEVYRANWELAQVLERAGRFEEAITALETVRQVISDRTSISRFLGSLQSRVGRMDDACVTLREALRREPEDPAFRMQVARACEGAGDVELAERILEEGIGSPIEDLMLARELIDLYRRQERTQSALFLLKHWIRQYPEESAFVLWMDQGEDRNP